MDWVQIWTLVVTFCLLCSSYTAMGTKAPAWHIMIFIVSILVPFARVMGLL